MSSVAERGTVTNGGARVARKSEGARVSRRRARRRFWLEGWLEGSTFEAEAAAESGGSSDVDEPFARSLFASSARRSRRPVSHSPGPASGSALAYDPGTTSWSGRRACVARARTVLHVPRRPYTHAPPALGSTAESTSAALTRSWFTTLDIGNAGGEEGGGGEGGGGAARAVARARRREAPRGEAREGRGCETAQNIARRRSMWGRRAGGGPVGGCAIARLLERNASARPKRRIDVLRPETLI